MDVIDEILAWVLDFVHSVTKMAFAVAIIVAVYAVIRTIALKKYLNAEILDLDCKISRLQDKIKELNGTIDNDTRRTSNPNGRGNIEAVRLNPTESIPVSIVTPAQTPNLMAQTYNDSSSTKALGHNALHSPTFTPQESRYVTVRQTGYFAIPVQESPTTAYFKEFFSNNDGGSARFNAEVTDKNATFAPIEGEKYLNDLSTSEQMRFAVDIQDYSQFGARSMIVESRGTALKLNERWVIIKKAEVKLI